MKRSKPCEFCSALRCVCVAVARVRLVAAEWNAAEVVIARAREVVTIAKVREQHLDGMVHLDASLAAYDAAVEAREAGP